MSTTDVVQATAVAGQFVAELTAKTEDAKALQKKMEPNASDCDFTENLLDSQPVKTSMGLLKEKTSGSTYEHRFAACFMLNKTAVEAYRTAQEHASKATLSCSYTTPGDAIKFNEMFLYSYENQGGATFTEGSTTIPITATGQWRVIVNLGLAFYPKGKVTDDVRYWTRRPHTNSAFRILPVNVFLIVRTADGAPRYIELIGETRFYREEINEDRVKRFSGARTITVNAGETISIEVQRGGEFGTVVDGATNTSYKESLGARKILDNRTGGNFASDLYNQITLVRIS